MLIRCAYLQVYIFYIDETVRKLKIRKTKAPQAVPIKDHLWVTIKLLYIVVSFVVIIAAIIMHNYNII